MAERPNAQPQTHALRVCALYPDLMNIYADRGNLIVLEQASASRSRPTGTTFSTSAAARIATSGCAPRT
jgi:hypothetical protein